MSDSLPWGGATPRSGCLYKETANLTNFQDFDFDFNSTLTLLLYSTMASAKRLLGCCMSDNRCTRKARRPIDYGTPMFPKDVRACTLNKSSLESSLAVSTPPDEISPNLWTCSICLGIPRVPAQITKCGHIGCMSCYLRLLQISGVPRNGREQRVMTCCPLCRVDFGEDNLKVFSSWLPLSKAVFGMVKVRCSLGAGSTTITCSWNGPIINLLYHETYECPVRQIVCPNAFCMYTDSEAKVKQHFGTCNYLQVRCDECCLPIQWVSRDTHDCEEALKAALRGKSPTRIQSINFVP